MDKPNNVPPPPHNMAPIPEDVGAPEEKEVPPRQARMTLVRSLYHTPSQGDSVGLGEGLGFYRFLQTSEQPYVRHLKVGPQWAAVEYGWLKDMVGYMEIYNREVPSPGTSREEIALHSIQLAVIPKTDDPSTRTMWSPEEVGPVPFAFIRPGEMAMFEPWESEDGEMTNLAMRCPAGARVTLAVVPR